MGSECKVQFKVKKHYYADVSVLRLEMEQGKEKIIEEDSLTIGLEEEGTINIHFRPFNLELFQITTYIYLINDEGESVLEDAKIYTVSSVSDFIFLVLALNASGYFDIIYSRPDAFDIIRKIPEELVGKRIHESKSLKLDKFCSIKYANCNIKINSRGSDSYFLAYPFDKDEKWPRIMTNLKKEFSKKNLSAVLPTDKIEDIPESGILFCNICQKILSTNSIIGETTIHNRNVMFELGYAAGVGRKPYFLVEKETERKEIMNFDLKRIDYVSVEDILDQFQPHILKKELDIIRSPAITNSCCDKEIKELEKTIFLLIPDNSKHQQVLKPALEKQINDLNYTITSPTSGHAICNTCESIQNSEIVIGDFVSDTTINRETLNMKIAFYLGLSLALGKKVIALQEKPHEKSMIDLVGLINKYVDVDDAIRIVHEKLSEFA